jgi:hypothetical protein
VWGFFKDGSSHPGKSSPNFSLGLSHMNCALFPSEKRKPISSWNISLPLGEEAHPADPSFARRPRFRWRSDREEKLVDGQKWILALTERKGLHYIHIQFNVFRIIPKAGSD